MTAPTQSTQFSANCKVGDDGSLQLIGAFAVRADIDPGTGELDQIVALGDHIGQLLKQKIAAVTIECADQRAARPAQDVASHLRKHGFLPPSSKNDSCTEIIDEVFSEEIEEEAEELYTYFTAEYRKNEAEID